MELVDKMDNNSNHLKQVLLMVVVRIVESNHVYWRCIALQLLYVPYIALRLCNVNFMHLIHEL